MNVPLSVAVIGAGFIAESHIPAWRNVGVRIVAVCERMFLLRNLRRKNGEYRNITEMFGDD